MRLRPSFLFGDRYNLERGDPFPVQLDREGGIGVYNREVSGVGARKGQTSSDTCSRKLSMFVSYRNSQSNARLA